MAGDHHNDLADGMTGSARPVVLIIVGHYIPGFKAGGVPRSVENVVNHLHREFQFLVITRDRDFGDDLSYPNIRAFEWQKVGNAVVYYVPPDVSIKQLGKIVCETPHDLMYLNSFFDPLTVKVLVNRFFGRTSRGPILLAPRGELASSSLYRKYAKKALYIGIARLLGLYRPVAWHAASSFEMDDIAKIMNIRREIIHVASDLPMLPDGGTTDVSNSIALGRADDCLHVVFLARICPEKNLEFALRVMGQVRTKVAFDIIGPLENVEYWGKCQRLLPGLPSHIAARFLGSIKPAQVVRTLEQYDLLLLPSGGESYGHVIAEALTGGTPVLISTNTPWRGLAAKGLGWDLPLDNPGVFARVIDQLASKSAKDRLERRKGAREYMQRLLDDPSVLQSNRELFNMALAGARCSEQK